MRIRMNWNVGTLVGVIVTGAAGYLGGIEVKKELDILAEGGEVSIKDKVVTHALSLLPVAAAAACTVFCYRKVKLGYEAKIADQAAKLALAALTTKQFKDYQDATKEVVGEETTEEIKKKAIEKDIERKKDQYFGVEDQSHLFRFAYCGNFDVVFRSTTAEVINGIVEAGRDIFDYSEESIGNYGNHGCGGVSVSTLLTYWGQGWKSNEDTDNWGWTKEHLIQTYGALFFDYSLKPCTDRLGREFIDIILFPAIEDYEYWLEKEDDPTD